jgi:small conductance mechanosensitive channel
MRAIWPALLGTAVFLAAGAIAGAQSFPGLSLSTPAPVTAAAIPVAPVVLDGQTLFSVAASDDSRGGLGAATRANDILAVIEQIVDGRAYDPRTLRVIVQQLGAEHVLAVIDAAHADPLPVVTVTGSDARAHLLGTDALAARWQETLQGALVHALVLREPAVQTRNLRVAGIVAVGLVLFTFAAFVLGGMLGRRIDALDEEHPRAGWLRALRGALLFAVLLAWFVAATWAALLFPQTTPYGRAVMQNALSIGVIWLAAGLVDRLISVAIERLPMVWDLGRFATADERSRQSLRVPTIVRAMNGFKTVVLIFVALLSTMTQLGIPVGSVVTIGGLAAIAVSLAAQNLIRDVVSGFLVLSEDQFAVGDAVTINGSSGIVERLTLRMVQVRDASGSLVTISHSNETSVVNRSRNWSRVDFAVAVHPMTDIDQALALLRSTIAELEADPQWSGTYLDAVEWVGLDGLSRDGLILRAWIKTAPLRQFELKRELNLRVARAFGAAGIRYGAVPPPGS